jgi:diaminohydroxyphosphoribosylaminopyrimidine deaminase/5-amino-6-(5-phosphoribosylamino)uracil reductase
MSAPRWTEADARCMREALRLARRGVGDTSPNPPVGAVLAREARIVGRGWHRRAGLPHAEIEALRRARERSRGATLYVTLEPCNHTGRTGPCCEAILAAGVRRVVAATRDPNPRTNGRGLARLRRAGVRVEVGLLEAEARELIAPFAKFIRTGLPWVTAKIAQSLDGKIAAPGGQSRWISAASARRIGHRLRREADAVVVGITTVLRDDPRLTVRDARRPARAGRPLRIVVDSRLRVPIASRCLAGDPPAIVATTSTASASRRRLERRGVTVLTLPALRGRVPLARLFKTLASRYDVIAVLVEGGGELIAGALRERLVDRLMWFVAPMVIGGRRSPSAVGGEGPVRLDRAIRLDRWTVRRVGPDLLIDAAVRYPHAAGGR